MKTTVLVFKNDAGDIIIIRSRFSLSEADPAKLSPFERCVAAKAREKGLHVEIGELTIPSPA